MKMLFSPETLIVIIAIVVFCVFIYTLYISIFSIIHLTSNNNKFASSAQWAGLYFYQSNFPLPQLILNKGNINILNFLKFAIIGVISTEVVEPTTEVFLSDEDLSALLEPILNEIVGNVISATFLQSLGLLTPSVIAFLESHSYIIQ